MEAKKYEFILILFKFTKIIYLIFVFSYYYNKRIAENVFARRKTAKSTPILPKEEPNNIRNTTKDGK